MNQQDSIITSDIPVQRSNIADSANTGIAEQRDTIKQKAQVNQKLQHVDSVTIQPNSDSLAIANDTMKVDTDSVATVVNWIPKPVETYDISLFADSIPYVNIPRVPDPDIYTPKYLKPTLYSILLEEIKASDAEGQETNVIEENVLKEDAAIKLQEQVDEAASLCEEISIIPDDYQSLYLTKYINEEDTIHLFPYILGENIVEKIESDTKKVSEQEVASENKEKTTIKEDVKTDVKPQTEKKVEKMQFLFYEKYKNEKTTIREDYLVDIEKLSKPTELLISQRSVSQDESLLQLETKGENAWMLWYIVAGLFVFVWLRMFYQKYIKATAQGAFNMHIANKLYYENNEVSLRSSFILNLLFYANIGLFIYQSLDYYEFSMPKGSGVKTSLMLGGGVMMIYIIKMIVLKFLGFVFKSQQYASEYIFSVNLYNKIFGLTLFPIVISIPYLRMPGVTPEHIIYLGFSLGGFFYLMRLIRGVVISLKQKISVFYLILYLCALELGPLLLLYKVLVLYGQFPF